MPPPGAAGDPTPPFFLFIGTPPDATIRGLKASGVAYRRKRLASHPRNWMTIVDLLRHPALIAVVAHLRADDYRLFAHDDYAEVSKALTAAISEVPYAVFVHDATAWADSERVSQGSTPGVVDHANHRLAPSVDDDLVSASRLLTSHRINVVTYHEPAELSVLSTAFIQERQTCHSLASSTTGAHIETSRAGDPPSEPAVIHSQRPARRVLFRSRRTQIYRALVGLILGLMGVFLVAPSLVGTPAPPPPWAMWVGVDFPRGSPDKFSTETYLNIHLSGRACDGRTTLSATLALPGAQPLSQPRSAVIVVALAGVSATAGSLSAPGQRAVALRPQHMRSTGRRGPTVLRSAIAAWTGSGAVRLRLTIHGSTRDAGFGSCYVNTPELFGDAANSIEWRAAEDEAGRTLSNGLGGMASVTSAVVDAAVTGFRPGAGTPDAQGIAVGDHVRLSCTVRSPSPDPTDPAAAARISDTRSNCVSAQLLRDPSATTQLNLRVFGGGLLLAAAVSMLIEALLTSEVAETNP